MGKQKTVRPADLPQEIDGDEPEQQKTVMNDLPYLLIAAGITIAAACLWIAYKKGTFKGLVETIWGRG